MSGKKRAGASRDVCQYFMANGRVGVGVGVGGLVRGGNKRALFDEVLVIDWGKITPSTWSTWSGTVHVSRLFSRTCVRMVFGRYRSSKSEIKVSAADISLVNSSC
ncbi:hypothetical protein BaRGS_00015844 [Batillaria attramentaria]|uniref:Uncharacterized protein n=1 Tax=Batillaria attramentaria TaxID=370345 RepID=A0ABD0L1G4_9CAEN